MLTNTNHENIFLMENISNLSVLFNILLNGMITVFIVLSLVFFLGKAIIYFFDSNSDEYYEEIDKRMKKEFPHKFNEEETQTSQPAQTVAPAKRSAKPGRKTVRLTPSQVAIANKLGVPLEEYAKYVE